MGDHRADERVPRKVACEWEGAEDLTALFEDEQRARLAALKEGGL